ncbi:MAG: guanylate kinase [Clostridia bacterium]|nr:guanylate kinase [Clostridia bacterium]
MQKSLLLMLSAPAGAGKGSLKELLLGRDGRFVFSVSATTREARPGEEDGVHYHFLSPEAFARMEAEGSFLEVATVHGNRYGTPLRPILKWMDEGRDILLEIDTQGAEAVSAKLADCVSVFILPPSIEELERRLVARNTENEESIRRRLQNARGEIAQMARYRYAIVNDSLETAYRQLEAIVTAERLNTVRWKPDIR